MVNEYYIAVEKEVSNAFHKEKTLELKQFLTQGELVDIIRVVNAAKPKKDVSVLTHSFSRTKIRMPPQINGFIKKVLGKAPTDWELWSFGHKDYTVVNDQALEKPGTDIIIDLTSTWSSEWGGSVVYVDGSGDFTKIVPEDNKLVLIMRDKKRHRFVQYVNHKAEKNKRVFLIARV
jgi:hypothetical protein